uniref:Phosphoesterase n=1 Tax=Archaeoglobus fulgidus TaxID=2234 RepID=A0A7J2TKU0_ARCFL
MLPERALLLGKTAIIADLHLGIENAMQKVGIAIPRMQIMDIISRTREIVDRYNIERLIIAGDLKHDFGENLPYEWDDVRSFLNSLDVEVSVVRGNHDNFLSAILSGYSIELKEREKVDDYIVVHGHVDCDEEKIILAHEHPAVKIRVRGAKYSFPCFLVLDKSKIVLPAFSKIVSGSDILQGDFLSPIVRKAKKIEVYAVEEEVFYLGELDVLRNIL